MIRAGFHVSRSTWDTSRSLQDVAYEAITVCGRTFQSVLLSIQVPYRGPATPPNRTCALLQGLGCSRFARHYSGNHYCFLFLRLLRCFTSPGVALKPYFIQTPVWQYYSPWVSPFGNLRIKACLPLPGAYRSLPRPSSPADAKASTMRPFVLDQNIGHSPLPPAACAPGCRRI